jgi:hypothetical protein
MVDFYSQTNLIIQGLVAVIILGTYYNLISSTKMYGGIIGKAVRQFGVGTLFVTLSIIETLLVTFGVIENSANLAIAQQIMNLIGLVALGLGFSTLVAGSKA